MTDTHHTTPTRATDMKAGFLGLIIGGLCLFAILYGIVRLTNHHFNTERPAAEATK
jgi:hypothetical protein